MQDLCVNEISVQEICVHALYKVSLGKIYAMQ